MKLCGYKIDAIVDQKGIIRMRRENQIRNLGLKRQDPKKRIYTNPEKRFEVFNSNSTLKKLCKFNEFLKYHKINVKKITLGVLAKIAMNYFNCAKQTAYNYAYAIWYLSM